MPNDPAQRQATEIATGEQGRWEINFSSFCEPSSLVSGPPRMCVKVHFVNWMSVHKGPSGSQTDVV